MFDSISCGSIRPGRTPARSCPVADHQGRPVRVHVRPACLPACEPNAHLSRVVDKRSALRLQGMTGMRPCMGLAGSLPGSCSPDGHCHGMRHWREHSAAPSPLQRQRLEPDSSRQFLLKHHIVLSLTLDPCVSFPYPDPTPCGLGACARAGSGGEHRDAGRPGDDCRRAGAGRADCSQEHAGALCMLTC